MRGNELLNLLLYGLDITARPNEGDMIQSDESWQRYHASHRSQLHRLRQKGLVERVGDQGANWGIQLTESGRLRALGGRDPEAEWRRPWEGKWHMLMFDLVSGNEAMRRQLLRWLHRRHFGCLQRSVWLRPDACTDINAVLDKLGAPAKAVLLFEGTPSFGRTTDATIAEETWDFATINEQHQRYVDFAEAGPPKNPSCAEAREWCGVEADLWKEACRKDPFLPDELLPTTYVGKKAWSARQRLLRQSGMMIVALDEDE